MTTNHHTSLPTSPTKVPATTEVIEAPLGELDSAITDNDERLTALEGRVPALSGNPEEYLNGEGIFAVPDGTGSTNGHVIQSEGVDVTQKGRLNFKGAVKVETGASSTDVTITAAGFPPLVAGFYHTTLAVIADGGDFKTFPSANQLHAIPFFIGQSVTINTMAIAVLQGVGGGKHVRIGIYADNNGAPGDLLIDAGEITDLSGTGTKTLSISQDLEPGLYWLAYISDTSSLAVRRILGTNIIPLMGLPTSSLGAATALTGYVASQSYDVLPSTFPTATITQGQMPAVFVKF